MLMYMRSGELEVGGSVHEKWGDGSGCNVHEKWGDGSGW